MNKLSTSLVAFGFSLTLISCGKVETMDRQAKHRKDINPELQGAWATNCEGMKINRLVFEGDKLTMERQTFLDNECQERLRTTTHTGKYELAHNYKEGIANSIVFTLDKEVTIALHTEGEVDAQNNTLATIRNDKAKEIRPNAGADERRQINRFNQLLRAGQEVESWKRDLPKKLTRLQAEKLDQSGLAVDFTGEFGSRLSLKYEVDNNFLQVSGGKDFGRVFSKR